MVAPELEIYAARLVRATQPQNSRFVTDEAKGVHDEMVNRYVMFGSSPRGAQALILGAKVGALLDGRANIAREDIERIAVSGLAHRIMLNYAAHSDGIDAAHIVERVIKSVRAARVLVADHARGARVGAGVPAQARRPRVVHPALTHDPRRSPRARQNPGARHRA